jgi:hypothetical protein
MEMGVMSRGGGEAGEPVNGQVQIQQTPAEGSVQTRVTLAHLALANNATAAPPRPGRASASVKDYRLNTMN